MILIIDAYNVLKYRFGDTFITDSQRATFINQIATYIRGRSVQVILVFDGGESSRPIVETNQLITIVYSGTLETADDYIHSYIKNYQHHNLLLISSDNELTSYAAHYAIPFLDTPFFLHLMHSTHKKNAKRKPSLEVIKLSTENNTALDSIMMTIADTPFKNDADDVNVLDDHPKSQTLSKIERKLLTKIKKLL